jgi:hypothetical protein
MNILNENQETRLIRNRLRLRLIQELEVACDEIKKDALYKMFMGESRTIMTFDYWINWISLDELKTVLEQVREENNKLIF